jgi:hypothetical protein
MTFLQGANFVLWLFQVLTNTNTDALYLRSVISWFTSQALNPFMPLWSQFAHMIFVGLLGGGMCKISIIFYDSNPYEFLVWLLQL